MEETKEILRSASSDMKLALQKLEDALAQLENVPEQNYVQEVQQVGAAIGGSSSLPSAPTAGTSVQSLNNYRAFPNHVLSSCLLLDKKPTHYLHSLTSRAFSRSFACFRISLLFFLRSLILNAIVRKRQKLKYPGVPQ